VAVRHVVHQVDGWEERGVVQASAGVEEEMTRLLCVDSALNLAPIIVQLIECDSGVNVSVEVLHVVDGAIENHSPCSGFFYHNLSIFLIFIVFIRILLVIIIVVVIVALIVKLVITLLCIIELPSSSKFCRCCGNTRWWSPGG